MKALYLCSTAILAGLSFPTIAHAQATDPDSETAASADRDNDSSMFGAIVVTAQKKAESTQDIPLAVTAFGGDTLTKLGVDSVENLTSVVPGFTVAQSYRGPPIYTLRGVGFNTPNLSASSPVGVYVDEIAYPYPVMTSGLSFDLERVEVLKGPQGTLFGRNTTGGLINLIARKPTYDSDGYVRVSVGNYQSYGVEGALGGGLSDTLAGRLSYKLEKSDKGWQESITRPGDRRGKVDKFSARLGLLWEPTSDVDVNLTGTLWRDNSETTVGQTIQIYPRISAGDTSNPDWLAGLALLGISEEQVLAQAFTPTNASQANWVVNDIDWGGALPGQTWSGVGGQNYTKPGLGTGKDNEMWSVASHIDWQLDSSLTFTSLTSYAKYDQTQSIDISGWEFENALGIGIGGIKSFQQELRLSGEFDKATFIAGGFYGKDKVQVRDRSWGATIGSLAGALRPLSPVFLDAAGGTLAEQEDGFWGFRDWENYTDQTVETWSVFAQGDYRPVDDLTITLGLRYTQDKTTSLGCSRDQGDNSIAATWNAFFNGIGIPANVAPGGCVTYLDDIEAPFLSRLDADPTNDLPYPEQGYVEGYLKQNNLAGRLAVNYQATPDLMVYASASRGFKSGAIPALDANVAPQLAPISQEELRAYEIGFKSSPWLGAVLNASMFYYDYRDKQVFGAVSDIIYGFLTRLVNVPKSRIYGAEAEFSAEVADGLSLRLAGTYLDTKIKQYTGFDQVGTPGVFDGARFTFTPKFQASGNLSYEFDVSDNLYSQFLVSGRYSSSQKGDFTDRPAFDIDSYAVFDANWSISTVDDKYKLEIFAQNIFDKYYWTSVQTEQDSIMRFAGMPRTYGAALTVNF